MAESYGVTLERGSDGTYIAWVDDLPGCAVRAPTRDEVLKLVPAAIRDFAEWAGLTSPASPEFRVVDEVESTIDTEEDTEVLVGVDRGPLTDEEWAGTRRQLEQSRLELLELLNGLTDGQLKAKREGNERTLREEIEHVAFVELMYLVWTFDLRSRVGLRDFLGWTRSLVAQRMDELAELNAAEQTWADWAGAPRLEPWTARKTARRLLWHELLHLRAIERFAATNRT